MSLLKMSFLVLQKRNGDSLILGIMDFPLDIKMTH